jgi:hypothetical protein
MKSKNAHIQGIIRECNRFQKGLSFSEEAFTEILYDRFRVAKSFGAFEKAEKCRLARMSVQND